MQKDTYNTIAGISEGVYTEKRSKFIAIALPVCTVEEVKSYLEEYQKKYYDARHVCYAYMLGAERVTFRANDNGEPSGTSNAATIKDMMMNGYPSGNIIGFFSIFYFRFSFSIFLSPA